MALHGYPGNIISASSPLYTPGFASGIWNLGSWPRGVTVVQTFTASGYFTVPAGVTAVALLDDTKYREINQDIFFALGFPKILTTGETERTQNSDPELAMISPTKSMENMQEKLLPILKSIVKEISIRNKLKDIPTVYFDKINLYAIDSFLEILRLLYEAGNISRETLDKSFRYNYEEEVKKRAKEEKELEKLGVPAFSPKPFSPQPTVPGENPQNNEKPDEESKETPEN